MTVEVGSGVRHLAQRATDQFLAAPPVSGSGAHRIEEVTGEHSELIGKRMIGDGGWGDPGRRTATGLAPEQGEVVDEQT